MRHRLAKLGVAGSGVLVATLTLAMPSANADYAPNAHDVVGVGSDTLQFAGDFVADGSFTGSAGYNTALNKYKVINFDATPDADARLAYGPNGVGTGFCGPGTGSTQGTGNATSTHADSPCVLNPTIVLRAGTKPVQRPNGSGAGAKALAGDTASGRDYITYARASSNQDSTLPDTSYDVMKIGSDPLAILTSTSTNAVPLSAAQLGQIYTCQITNWTQLDNTPYDNGVTPVPAANTDYTYPVYYYTQTDVNDGFTPNTGNHTHDVQLTSGTIIPIIPQLGSGTRSSFESLIGVTDSQVVAATGSGSGKCVQVGEENDPTAIAAQSSPNNAIEPMSGGRLNLFEGLNGAGTSTGKGGFFQDPSCPLTAAGTPSGTGDCTSASGSGITGQPITPSVNLTTTGTPSDDETGCASGMTCNGTGGNPAAPKSSTLLDANRGLYIYFRQSSVDAAAGWQPGTYVNAIRTLFYDPCDPATSNNGSAGVDGPDGPDGQGFEQKDCLTINGVLYGPSGQPYYAKSAGQADISSAGIAPTYEVSTTGTSGLS